MSRALARLEGVVHITMHTGQHYDRVLSDIFFEELELRRPDIHLGLGAAGRPCLAGGMEIAIENTLPDVRPDIVIVYGDTNSTLAAALAAAKLGMDIAHVEAGLRCGDLEMPEELNRRVTDQLSGILLCPTESARRNLEAEKVAGKIFVPGDVMVDTFHIFRQAALERSSILETLSLEPGGYMLLTAHRAENTRTPSNLLSILEGCAAADTRIVFPVHPRTVRFMQEHGIEPPDCVEAVEPVSYVDMLALEAHAAKILTDSGGVQKEAYLSGVPCVTLRERTEWVETVEEGWNILAGADRGKIAEAIADFRPGGERPGIFGPPGAAERMAEIIVA